MLLMCASWRGPDIGLEKLVFGGARVMWGKPDELTSFRCEEDCSSMLLSIEVYKPSI